MADGGGSGKNASDPRMLLAEARRLKGLGRLGEALDFNLRAVDAAPQSAIAEHNLAATLGDLSRYADAEAATSRALSKGLDAPETWLVRARALQGLGRLEEAIDAYDQVLRRRHHDLAGHHDLAQLLWMTTGDVQQTTSRLDRVIGTEAPSQLILIKARVLEAAGAHGALLTLLDEAAPQSTEPGPLHQAAAHAASLLGDADRQLWHARNATALMPGDSGAMRELCKALIHTGRLGEAEQALFILLASMPDDQELIAIETVLWRLRDDPRVKARGAGADHVALREVACPAGWPDLAAYLHGLADALRGLHRWTGHPLGQSLRGGSQTQTDLLAVEHPAIEALFIALDGPIRDHIAGIGAGTDSLRRRCTGDYRLGGAWSVLLRPGGVHVDHVHPQGWLSAVFYVELPSALDRDREGWLALGRPGIPTRPPLGATAYIRPAPGHVALFPAYVWHGTERFAGGQSRLTVAFDILPA